MHRNRRQARKNACDLVAIGFDFASDLLSKWRASFFKPITESCKAKPKQYRIYVAMSAPVYIALIHDIHFNGPGIPNLWHTVL